MSLAASRYWFFVRRGLPVERDLHFMPSKTISAYADEARRAGRIVL
jgi:hypothetical protein